MEDWYGTHWLCTGQLGGTKPGGSTRQAHALRPDLSGKAERKPGETTASGCLPGICAGRGYVGRDPPGPVGPLDPAPVPNRGGVTAEARPFAGARSAD